MQNELINKKKQKQNSAYEMSLFPSSHPPFLLQKYDYWDKECYESENDVYTVV